MLETPGQEPQQLDGVLNSMLIFALLLPLVLVSLDTMKKMEQAVSQIRESVQYDGLTRVLSRSHFLDLLRSSKDDGYLLLIDADKFKLVNDTHGHAAGDDALVHLANAIEWSAGSDALVGRLSGEEFAVFIPNANRAVAHDRAEAIRSRVARYPLYFNGKEIDLSVSIGGVKRFAGEPLREALTPADKCLYAAKDRGRNTIVFAELGSTDRRPGGRLRVVE